MRLTIEKLVYGGDGLARLEQADGKRKTVFVPLVLPGERVEAKTSEERPGFARAELEQVLEPSPQRAQPPCPYFGRCGGCHYQHASYDEQLRLKREILRETVARIAKIELPDIETHASPPLHYRNRTRMALGRTNGLRSVLGRFNGVTERFAIGYRKLGSHELLPVRECPISSPLINRALAALWELAAECDLPKGLVEIGFFAGDRDETLLLEFMKNEDGEPLNKFAEALRGNVPEIAGVAVLPAVRFQEELPAAPELEGRTVHEPEILLGTTSLTYRVGTHSYRVSAGSFFQTNRHLTEMLIELACGGAEGNVAMDLYAGVGLFTLSLAERFARVTAIEAAPASYADLQANAPAHVKALGLTTEAFLARAPRQPDFAVVDPPRAGLGKRVVEGLVRMKPKSLAYVSCDPSTLARDLPVLVAAGYRITQAHFVDLFPQTFHIETVLRMER